MGFLLVIVSGYSFRQDIRIFADGKGEEDGPGLHARCDRPARGRGTGGRDNAALKYLLKRLLALFTKEYSLNKIYNESRSGGFSIGKNALYSMADAVFSVFVVASVERYDPSVVRREMSSKKVYAFDSGMVSAVHFSTSGDRGKYLENFVFAHLRFCAG